MTRFKRLRKGTAFKAVIIFTVLLFTVSQVVEVFFEVNYSAIPRYIVKKLGATRVIPSSDLLRDELIVHSTNSNVPNGFPRLSCACDNSEGDGESGMAEVLADRLKSDGSSSCSNEATVQGPNQKVISFSLFMSDPGAVPFFLEGVEPNLDKIREYFPGWLVRIYTNIPLNKYSCPFICKYDFLYWCDIKHVPELGDLSEVNGRVWRYLPVGDPTVDIVISRDLDSTTSAREREAVAEWVVSNKTVHVLRDSQWHDTEILAGLWGIKNYGLKPKVARELQWTLMTAGKRKQTKFWDQSIAEKYIYFPYKGDLMSHDSYFCGNYPESVVRPFPTQREGEEFVGHDDRKEMNLFIVGRLSVCPVKCRPEHGKDWKYC